MFSKKNFMNTLKVSNDLDPDQDRQNVGPDFGPNCLQRLSANNKRQHYLGRHYSCGHSEHNLDLRTPFGANLKNIFVFLYSPGLALIHSSE